jgi:hypothetical protein
MNRPGIFEKTLTYSIAIIISYTFLIVFLGDPAKGLIEKGITEDVLLRRNFLIKALSSGPSAADFFDASNMQFAGEWTIGTYSMATYALTNIAMFDPLTAKESSEIVANWIQYCLEEKVYAFDKAAWNENPLDEQVLNADRGHLGYYGHLNLMLGCYALLNNDGKYKELHLKISNAIAKRMAKYGHRHVETYPLETYPPDNSVAVASLKVADITIGTNYKELVNEWVQQSKQIEDKPYGLIAFQIDSVTGKPLQSCRGSHIGWNSFFMPLIDAEYAGIQFQRFKKFMLFKMPGLAAFKEYPKGNFFRIDCDTGPVIFGLGGTATGFSVAGARWSLDKRLLTDLLRTIEMFGTSVKKKNMKKYIVSPVVGDAIMLAMKTACPWRPIWK